MTADLTHTVVVPRALETLVPGFLDNRRRELEALRVALAADDYESLRQAGHRMKGAAATYGFERISTIGDRIEQAAGACDADAIAKQIADYAAHLQRLRVSYA